MPRIIKRKIIRRPVKKIVHIHKTRIKRPKPVKSALPEKRRTKLDTFSIFSSLFITAIVIVMIIILAGSRPWAHPEMVEDLNADYEISADSIPTVILTGKIYNYGDRSGYASLSVTITDNRGYSMTDDIELGLIKAGGGYTTLTVTYKWPSNYNGYGDSPDMVLPIALDSELTWRNA